MQAYRADQFQLQANFRAHYQHTGPELWRQTAGELDGFVDFVGSGGTFAGTATFLKEQSGGAARCFVVEPAGAAVLAAKHTGCSYTATGHRVQGGGYSQDDLVFIEQVHACIDGFFAVTDDDAVAVTRQLAREEGIYGGFSGGANVHAALQLLGTEWGRGKTIAAVICDSGLKYLSTDLWPE